MGMFMKIIVDVGLMVYFLEFLINDKMEGYRWVLFVEWEIMVYKFGDLFG